MTKRISFDIIHDDEKAVDIGQALAAITKNSHVTLYIFINDLTGRGAQAIAQGLKQSQIEQLCITSWTDIMLRVPTIHESVLQPILEAAIQHIPDLQLYFRFGCYDDLATMLSGMLLRLDAQANNRALQSLWLSMEPNMTLAGAQQLAVGLRHAKIKCLRLAIGLSREVMSTVYPAAIQTAEKLALENFFNDEIAIELGDALIGNTNLQSFEFGLPSSIDAAKRLANGISQSHIVHLDIEGPVSVEVEDTLYHMVARSPTIQQLAVGWICSGTPGLVQCLPKLHKLEIHCGMVTEKLQMLMMGLRNAPHLTSLVLAGTCYKDPQDVVTVCAALPHLTSLTNLSMCCKLACDEQQQADGVAPLDLASQRIPATTAEQLMVAVANHPSLVRLTLDDCTDIGFAGLEMIGMHLPNTRLKVLKYLTNTSHLTKMRVCNEPFREHARHWWLVCNPVGICMC